MSNLSSLVSTTTHVETPFIIVTIGEHKFGHCETSYRKNMQERFNIVYPNYMKSLQVTKINGAVNTYTLSMTYGITQFDDPNKFEKIFSSISKTRRIKLSYGDWGSPQFIYKEEEAMIQKLSTKVDVKNSQIEYVINCISTSGVALGASVPFPSVKGKPSEILKRLVLSEEYRLLDIFPGMKNASSLEEFIAGDDKEVNIKSKTCSPLEYISYLVSYMTSINDNNSSLKSSCYFWSTYDDVSGKYGGTYFKVVRVDSNAKALTANTYEIDVGYPTNSFITGFSINNDDSWSLLYDYSSDVQMPQYNYYINDSGEIIREDASTITNSRLTYSNDETKRNWWSLVTQFPITATLTMRGLLRPAMLMSYVKVNTYFYGSKHISSGLYVITKQEDSITSSGYTTTLTLLRIGGDEYYV